jgi:hypothetical protein
MEAAKRRIAEAPECGELTNTKEDASWIRRHEPPELRRVVPRWEVMEAVLLTRAPVFAIEP